MVKSGGVHVRLVSNVDTMEVYQGYPLHPASGHPQECFLNAKSSNWVLWSAELRSVD